MEMSEGEIVKSYQQSKYKSRQPRILAELNNTSKEEIIEILKKHGEIQTKNREKSVLDRDGDYKTSVDIRICEYTSGGNGEKSVQDEHGTSSNTENTGTDEDEEPENRKKTVCVVPETIRNYIHTRIEELHALEAACHEIIASCVDEYGELREFMTAYGIEE